MELDLSNMGRDDRKTRTGYKDDQKRKAFDLLTHYAMNLEVSLSPTRPRDTPPRPALCLATPRDAARRRADDLLLFSSLLFSSFTLLRLVARGVRGRRCAPPVLRRARARHRRRRRRRRTDPPPGQLHDAVAGRSRELFASFRDEREHVHDFQAR